VEGSLHDEIIKYQTGFGLEGLPFEPSCSVIVYRNETQCSLINIDVSEEPATSMFSIECSILSRVGD
jgi:hypothetical protein